MRSGGVSPHPFVVSLSNHGRSHSSGKADV